MMRTVSDLATELDVSEKAARGLVTFLVETKLARFRGERPATRGKGAHVYTIETGAGDKVRKMLARVEG